MDAGNFFEGSAFYDFIHSAIVGSRDNFVKSLPYSVTFPETGSAEMRPDSGFHYDPTPMELFPSIAAEKKNKKTLDGRRSMRSAGLVQMLTD